MVTVNGVKYACDRCIRGHRVSGCKHIENPLRQVKRKGRPPAQCATCRKQRSKGNSSTSCCDCGSRTGGSDSTDSDHQYAANDFSRKQISEPDEIARLRNDPSVQVQLPDGTSSGPGDKKIPPSEQHKPSAMEIRFEHPDRSRPFHTSAEPQHPYSHHNRPPHINSHYEMQNNNPVHAYAMMQGPSADMDSSYPQMVHHQSLPNPYMQPPPPHAIHHPAYGGYEHVSPAAGQHHTQAYDPNTAQRDFHRTYDGRESPPMHNEDELLHNNRIRYKKDASHNIFPPVNRTSENNQHSARLNALGDNNYAPNTGSVEANDPEVKLESGSDLGVSSQELADSLSGLEPNKQNPARRIADARIDPTTSMDLNDQYSTGSAMRLSNLY